ncbi:zinc finger, MIZ-type, Zinc finger, RING/FYVE/PHD-type, E3 SUMO protein ligase [Artemisia annua]|uniref:Zinc finger, MIZ-type, Zinc finger, RING/FYVE/PHD-type, E3 SUMO protein ligase n=1 Tax=Artemisia annua TaxID=35608 RepID=A0A2U1Q0T8_ARTAN|nr:zinc finger, MIZ-type, Zinc finger, RING/FYVE/PHD-type, E3 SUMO protein ligase [Artemisia annua]
MAEMYMMAAVAASRKRAASLEGVIKLVEAYIDHVSVLIRSGDINTPDVYNATCLTLGRCSAIGNCSTIETAIGVKVAPSSSHLHELLWIVKEVYRLKTQLLEPALMMLMIHIKSACQDGWFLDEDKDCLLRMADEASLGYFNLDNMDIEPTNEHTITISDIISRFYPRMTVEQILISFAVKAGEGPPEADFYIAPNTVPNQNVGKGPQLPSNVTKMVKDGVNNLQVFGEFDGDYVIALAYMNLISSSDSPQLQDYVYPRSSDVSSDCVITEEISLICPNSGCRISTPVKGHLCKHSQCFDYEFFMKANSIKPTWKCPLASCRKPISNLDIRIDQNFLKILNEVAENVSIVYISDEGSWTVDPSAIAQPAVTTPAVSPHIDKDTSLVSQGSGDMLNTPSPIQETRHHLDPVNSTPTQLSAEIKQQSSQGDQASEPESGSSITKRARSTFNRARRAIVVIPVQLTPPSTAPVAMQLRNRSKPIVGTTNQDQDTTPAAAVKLRRGRKQRKISTLCQSAPTPSPAPVPTPTPAPAVTRPASPVRLQEPSEDAVSCVRMRGGLEGEKLEAARLALLAPPKQPIDAADPWSIPSSTIPMEVLMSRPPISNSSN